MVFPKVAEFHPILNPHHGLLAYATGLTTACLVLAAATATAQPADPTSWLAIVLLGGVAWVAEKQSVRVGANSQMSITVLPILFAAVAFGPLVAMAVGALSHLADFGAPHARWWIWTTSRALGAGLAGVAAVAVLSAGSSFMILVAAVGAAAIVEATVDVLLNATTVRVRRTGSFVTTLWTITRLLAGALPLYVPVIALLAYAYRELSPWTVLLFFVPALAAQRLFLMYEEQRRLAEDLAGANSRLESANLSFATALVATLDARDRYTAGHSAAVAIYSRDIALRMGLSDEQQRLAHVAGLVHDIGKVGLPPGLLEKAGPLTLEERRQMERHSIIGERILSNVDDYGDVAGIVRHHHERVDGRGYPDGLVGDAVPLISRIIAVADAYNAMTSDRPYREAMPSRVARLRLAQAVESQFDTSVVAAFEAILAGADESYRLAEGPEFSVVRPSLPPAASVEAA